MTSPSRPNPLTDELPADVKAELAALFSEMKKRCDEMWGRPAPVVKRRHRQFWERTGW